MRRILLTGIFLISHNLFAGLSTDHSGIHDINPKQDNPSLIHLGTSKDEMKAIYMTKDWSSKYHMRVPKYYMTRINSNFEWEVRELTKLSRQLDKDNIQLKHVLGLKKKMDSVITWSTVGSTREQEIWSLYEYKLEPYSKTLIGKLVCGDYKVYRKTFLYTTEDEVNPFRVLPSSYCFGLDRGKWIKDFKGVPWLVKNHPGVIDISDLILKKRIKHNKENYYGSVIIHNQESIEVPIVLGGHNGTKDYFKLMRHADSPRRLKVKYLSNAGEGKKKCVTTTHIYPIPFLPIPHSKCVRKEKQYRFKTKVIELDFSQYPLINEGEHKIYRVNLIKENKNSHKINFEIIE